jgi:hypothetical protein
LIGKSSFAAEFSLLPAEGGKGGGELFRGHAPS